MAVEKLCDLDVMPVFFAFQIVFNEDQPLIRRTMDSIKFAVRASFFNWPDSYMIDIQARKMYSRSPEKQCGSHGGKSDVDVAMDAADFSSVADNTTMKLTFGSNFCAGPQNSVFEHCVGADPAMFSDD